ncbi:Sec1-like protein [Hyaloraphidium curvatum]|nr:Sec1-like protein [Hyaloraphidium curvatum]
MGPPQDALPNDLRAVLRGRLFDGVLSAGGADRWRVLVVDPATVRVLGSAFSLTDVLDKRIVAVEAATRRRVPRPEMPAVYFVEPSAESVGPIEDDFRGKARYSEASVVFSAPPPPDLKARLGTGPAGSFLSDVDALRTDFLPLSPRTFALPLAPLPTPTYFALSPLITPAALDAHLRAVARGIASAASSLGNPRVRFHSRSRLRSNLRPLVEILAGMVRAELDRIPFPETEAERPVLVLADRSLDPAAPLLHELTYEAMARDLLGLKGSEWAYDDAAGVKRTFRLEPDDPLWMANRHLPIDLAARSIASSFDAFSKTNAAARKGLGDAKATASVDGLRAAVHSLPAYYEEKARYAGHVSLCGACIAAYEARRIARFVGVERMLLRGGAGGDALDAARGLLADPATQEGDRLRLLLLALVALRPAEPARTQLVLAARLSPLALPALANVDIVAGSFGVYRREYASEAGEREEDGYVPVVADVLADAARGTLDTTLFPYLAADIPPEPVGAPPKKKPWDAFGFPKKKEPAPAASPPPAAAVFVLGGATYSELRAAHAGGALFAGTDAPVSPADYVEALRQLTSPPAEPVPQAQQDVGMAGDAGRTAAQATVEDGGKGLDGVLDGIGRAWGKLTGRPS